MKMAKNCIKLLEIAKLTEWSEMAGNEGNGWKWMEWLEIPGND